MTAPLAPSSAPPSGASLR
uniref:Uncharacterized protein n=1 Tax=Anguilla anguilla TaxID=7936 RepID=A0A0E9XHR0_ANGAN